MLILLNIPDVACRTIQPHPGFNATLNVRSSSRSRSWSRSTYHLGNSWCGCLLDPTPSPASVQWWVYKVKFRMRASTFSAQFVFLFMQFTRKFDRIIGWCPLLRLFPPWEILDPLLAHTGILNFTKNIKFREREQGVMKTPSPPASWKNCHWLG